MLFSLAALLLMSFTGAAALPAVSYSVAPVVKGDVLAGLAVEMRFSGNHSGEEILDLPNDNADGHPHLADLSVIGAQVSDEGPAKKRLRFRPGAKLVVRYRLLPGSDKDPDGQSQAPIIRPGWFAVHGQSALIVPEGHDRDRAQISYVSAPSGWTLSSNLSGRTTTISDVRETMLVGGRRYREIIRKTSGETLRLAFPPEFATQAEGTLDDIARIDASERAFWRSPGQPFFVAIVPLAVDAEFEGRGLNGGFVLFLGSHPPKGAWLHLLAHEHMHTWISRQIGGFPYTYSDLEAWLNEGFTEALTARVLLQSGIWSIDQFVADQNASWLRYGTSPVKEAPNARINADRNKDRDVNKLPYDRGRLLALLWDSEIRQQTSGRVGLDDVMRAQVRQASSNSRHGQHVSADLLFPRVVKQMTGLDLSEDIRRYVERGEPIDLPRDLFGPCASVVRVTQPIFDRGFDLEGSFKSHGHVVGLEHGGPAERAGLHAGDRILIDEVPGHDSQKMLTYTVVEDGGHRRLVSYKPEGKGQVAFQQLKLTPQAHLDWAQCTLSLSRP